MFVSVKSIGVSPVAVAPRGNVPTVIRLPSVPKSLPHNQLPLVLEPRGNVPNVLCLPSVPKSLHHNQLPVTSPCKFIDLVC